MKSRENKIYIAYGSNLNMKQMARRCPYATVIGSGRLNGYTLLFRGGQGSAVATIEPKKGGSVPVVLWEITPRCEDALDRYEGTPRLYRKETVGVEFDGKVVEAMAYIMNDGFAPGIPDRAYMHTILEGYASAAFDPVVLDHAILASVRKRRRNKL